ncbi:MAG TPA: hypothetical protein VEY07_01705 [Thermoplasmata archaeon]|nr:hypothetical protein [Thermoplasmata archaeon]
MLPALVALFYVPVLGWVSIGVVLLVAFRRSGPRFVLRLAAAFLALWALLATTTLVWVLANGGLAGVFTLFHAPFVMFDPRYSILWLVGALGVLLIFSLAFTLNQLVGR